MKTILVVDDNIYTISTIKNLLKDYYKVSGVTSSKRAISFYKRKKPDIILIDIYMPEMDGIELLQHINKLGNMATPVIMLTIISDVSIIRKCKDLGAIQVLDKPIDASILISTIDEILS